MKCKSSLSASASSPSRFPLGSEDCELLADFAGVEGLAELAELRRRDLSVVSRQIKRIAETYPVLEKKNGKWIFTSLGADVVHWTRETMLRQQEVLASRRRLSIAATAEFGARILATNLESLTRANPNTTVAVRCAESSIENLILSGQADFGFDCGRPNSPLVRFHLVQEEPITLVASPTLLKKKRISALRDLTQFPFLQYTRMPAHKYLELDRELAAPSAIFDTIATARAASIAGLGWTVLPAYAVREEIREGKLIQLTIEKPPALEKFGVWWLRENRTVQPWIDRAIDWLGERKL